MLKLDISNLNLRISRMRSHLTQAQLAAHVGVSQAFLSRVEAEGHIPSKEMRYQIANVLGEKAEHIFPAQKHKKGGTRK